MFELYQLWIAQINRYFEENRLKFLVLNVEPEIIDFLEKSQKSIVFRKNIITFKFYKELDYIEYRYVEKDITNNELDSNIIKFENFYDVEKLFVAISSDIDVAKMKKHLNYGEKYKDYFLTFMSCFQQNISEVGNPYGLGEVLIISTNGTDIYIVPSHLKEQIKIQGLDKILDISKYEEITHNGFSVYQLHDKESK
ncbi:hypothetical protein [Bacillus thuringiensis]|uniref:hypothetical protein n=1 Tax=Bacillus thuringiensis TaxID=1428 RepID=UPI0021D69241|nr:hypothetical protein [Bacillus thuringiensis]MCU7666784.1 hypothetical protein [Bacillus thuringiensis]